MFLPTQQTGIQRDARDQGAASFTSITDRHSHSSACSPRLISHSFLLFLSSQSRCSCICMSVVRYLAQISFRREEHAWTLYPPPKRWNVLCTSTASWSFTSSMG